MIGKSIAHYTTTEKIGEGGMGEVYRATDTKLDRDVALKVLPKAFTGDPQRMARFEREAKVLASLNHPNIGAIHGLEEEDGVRALVLELIEGDDLSEHIAKGPIRLEKALQIALQIAEALEAAHEKGIIHRDLKPANVKITPEGQVKVLDFGLAKAMDVEGSAETIANSPTLSMQATQAGIILGTAGYMSPEQARGQEADHRADIWALGVILFEMLTGAQIFRGKTISDSLAKVLEREPDWERLPPGTSVRVGRLLEHCLAKNVKMRLQAIGDARLTIGECLEEPTQLEQAPAAWGRWTGLLWALGGAVVGLIAAWVWLARPNAAPGVLARFEIVGATGETLIDPWSLRISPDGQRIAWIVEEGTQRAIHLREIDALETLRLPDTDGVAEHMAFSPDSQSIAFYANNKLHRFDLGDRSAMDLCDAIEGGGISWGSDDTIVFSDGWIGPLSRRRHARTRNPPGRGGRGDRSLVSGRVA